MRHSEYKSSGIFEEEEIFEIDELLEGQAIFYIEGIFEDEEICEVLYFHAYRDMSLYPIVGCSGSSLKINVSFIYNISPLYSNTKDTFTYMEMSLLCRGNI